MTEFDIYENAKDYLDGRNCDRIFVFIAAGCVGIPFAWQGSGSEKF
jgi:hypothetical protein